MRERLLAHPTASLGLGLKTESVVYDLAKFLGLCAAANPNALEVLFADERDWVYETETWRRLHRERHRFLSKKVQQTYLGYAMAQLKRIKTHRSWLLNPPARKPTRGDFGLPDTGTMSRDDQYRIEQSVAEKVRSYGIDTLELPKSARIAVQERLRAFWIDVLATSEDDLDDRVRALATRALQLPAEVVDALNAERKYRSAMKHWEAYQTWIAERNPARAELERRHGYDTKHAMHLLRLMRTGLEVLATGELLVRRPDADELNAVRDGALTFDALLASAADLEARMHDAARTTSLPAEIDLDFVNRLALELIRESTTSIAVPSRPPTASSKAASHALVRSQNGRWAWPGRLLRTGRGLRDRGSHPLAELADEILPAVEMAVLEARAQLVDIGGRRRRLAPPLGSLRIEEIDVPCRLRPSELLGQRVSDPALRVVELPDAGALGKEPGRLLRGPHPIPGEHVDPDDRDAHGSVRECLDDRLLHRTGAVDAGPSRRGEQSEKPRLVLGLVEVLLERPDRLLERDDLLDVGRCGCLRGEISPTGSGRQKGGDKRRDPDAPAPAPAPLTLHDFRVPAAHRVPSSKAPPPAARR